MEWITGDTVAGQPSAVTLKAALASFQCSMPSAPGVPSQVTVGLLDIH
jgi:hypothetical protein